MERKFKYQNEYEKLMEVCPPSNFETKNINPVFRWTFDDVHTNKNYKPQYFRNPARFNDKNDKLKCMAMGLSFFDNEEDAQKRFDVLKQISGETIKKVIGDNISKGYIEEKDGVNGDFGTNGHFTHHAYDPEIFHERFEKFKELL